MTDHNDEDLQNLLDELDEEMPTVEPEDVDGSLSSINEMYEQTEPTPVSPQQDLEPSLPALQPIHQEVKSLDNAPPPEAPPPTNDMFDIFGDKIEQLQTVTTEVLQACRSDRQEAQEVIDDLKNRLNSMSTNGPPSKALVDGLVKAVEVKANINQNAIRIMDTNAKYIAAFKSSISINNNNTTVATDMSLRQLLEENTVIDEDC